MTNDPRQLKWASKYPNLGMSPIPTLPCIDPDFFELEREAVFRKTWLKVGRVEEIANVGDYKVKKIAVAKTSVILIHGKDGVIRGFHNTCSHRGNKVVVETGEETFGRGKAAVVTCRFHGWVYNAEGKLINVPEEERFSPCFTREDNGLEPVHTDVWQGFIFINLERQTPQPLAEYLGEFAEHFAGFPFSEMTLSFGYHTTLNCNWKIALDAFAEAYHVPTIHAGSFPGAFTTGLTDVKLMGDHRTAGVCLTQSNSLLPVAQLSSERTITSMLFSRGASILPPLVNPSRREDFAFELSVCFPNILVHVAEGAWFTHQFWPLSHNRTQCLQRNAWLEDTATMEDTHEALASGSKKFMVLQDEEILVRHGYHVLDKYISSHA
jgi:phenylpropionate dioxygenase-like ring-hydroxylating dioxygenase large terminal subunit